MMPNNLNQLIEKTKRAKTQIQLKYMDKLLKKNKIMLMSVGFFTLFSIKLQMLHMCIGLYIQNT